QGGELRPLQPCSREIGALAGGAILTEVGAGEIAAEEIGTAKVHALGGGAAEVYPGQISAGEHGVVQGGVDCTGAVGQQAAGGGRVAGGGRDGAVEVRVGQVGASEVGCSQIDVAQEGALQGSRDLRVRGRGFVE